MDVFVARQPIFNKKMEVFGYELLHRRGDENYYSEIDGDMASSNVIVNSFLTMGMDKLTGGRKAFINFTKNLIKGEIATILPKELLVLEILENIEPDEGIINACKNMKKAGYTLALDDFVFKPEYLPLIEFSDIIKIDFLTTPVRERQAIVKNYGPKGVKFLAEKIETHEDFEQAKAMGYSYFQGYFFSKPVILSAREIPPYKLNYLQLIKSLNETDPDFAKLALIIERDVSLSFELLKLVNSAAFYRRNKINSIKQALGLLGLGEIKKWVSLVALRKIGEDKPNEVIRCCVIRAKFMEMLAPMVKMQARSSELFMTGIFSMIDVLTNRTLLDILVSMPVSDEVKQTLLGEQSAFSEIYSMIMNYEKGEWDRVKEACNKFKLDAAEVSGTYIKAVDWVNQYID